MLIYVLQGIAQSSLAKSGVTLLGFVKMHRKAVSVLKCLNVCYFKHGRVQTCSLYLGNISTSAKSISEKLGSVGIKAGHLTLICPFLKDGGGAQSVHSLPLTMFSCLCLVPAPSSEGAVGEGSACLDTTYNLARKCVSPLF